MKPTTDKDSLTVPLNKDLTFWYKATVRRVYDGDTFHCDIELGLNHTFHYQRIRMNRINTPELKGRSRRKGLEARDYLRSIILTPDGEGKEIMLNTVKDRKGKYGRFLGEAWIYDYEAEAWININDKMLESGHAKLLE